MSLLGEGGLVLDNPQSREEDEYAEEQRRRQEELTDLLAHGFNAFHYDESAINSSATSVEEPLTSFNGTNKNFKYDGDETEKTQISGNLSDTLKQSYKDADIQGQLRVLYDVRVREISKLREEFDNYKEENAKELGNLKKKATLAEAEVRHLQVTLSNSESLLVEKTESINGLTKTLHSKDEELKKFEKLVNELNLEICSYKSTIDELHLKQADNNPFNTASRKFQSEELQKVHQDQILKVESLFQEESKKCKILEKQNLRLQEDLKKLLSRKNEADDENNLTIVALSKKLQSAREQSKDLFLLGEALKKENDHLKERVHQLETNKFDTSGDGFGLKNMDKATLAVHVEKLRRMLLDKDLEMKTLQSKLRFYDSDLHELFEYRNLLNKIYSSDFQPCSNLEHEEAIVFMQRQLQSYEQAVEDRNKQIINLTEVNKELKEKIEEMIQQTRKDIENLSQRYSLPQLETMSKELQNAEKTINELKNEVLEKQELIERLESSYSQSDKLAKELKEFKEQNGKMHQSLEAFMKTEALLVQENARAKSDLQKICAKLGISEADLPKLDEDIYDPTTLKSRYEQVHNQLHQIAVHLEKSSPKKMRFSVIHKLKEQILHCLEYLGSQKLDKADIEEKLEQWNNLLCDVLSSSSSNSRDIFANDANSEIMLQQQLQNCMKNLQNAEEKIAKLKERETALLAELQENEGIIKKRNSELEKLSKQVQFLEESKTALEKQLENTQKKLEQAKEETLELHKEVHDINEDIVRKNLFKELKDVENVLQQSRTEDEGNEAFQKCLQAEILKVEILLRDRLQEESVKQMQKIEEQYRKVITERLEIFRKEKEKWRQQEASYRQQFASTLEMCGQKMEELRIENIELVKKTNALVKEYKDYRNDSEATIERCKRMVEATKKNTEVLNNKWTNVLSNYMEGATNLEKQNQKSIKTISKNIETAQRKVDLLEASYQEKVREFRKSYVTN